MKNNFTTKRIGEENKPKKTKASFKKKISFKPRSLNWRRFGKEKDWKKILMMTAIGLPLFGIVVFFSVIVYFSIGLPDVRNLDQYRVSQSTFIYDRNGEELYAIHGDENRESIEIFDRNHLSFDRDKCEREKDLCTLSEGYRNIVLATIAIEDDHFYDHHGFDAERLFKAVLSQFLPNVRARGGSTITQQYIKNTLLSPERKISRKIRELILAVKLENVFNKEEILELYLNRIPYGSNSYGVELAAKTYFNKSAVDLTLAEAAILAALPNAPTRYSPYGNYRHAKLLKNFSEKEAKKIHGESDLEGDEFVRGLLGTVVDVRPAGTTDVVTENTEEEVSEEESETAEKPEKLTPKNTELGNGHIYIKGRTDLVLQRMEQLGFITEGQMEEALEESWTKEFTRARENILAPHFVLHIKQTLEEKYGKEVVEQGGLKVYTTLDYDLQKIAEEVVEERKEFNQTNFEAGNIALVSMDPESGEVLAMVGSADYFDEEIDGSVNMAMSYIQPGSSFKPFVFALAFARGALQPATVLYDVETGFGGHSHTVENYDGEFLGPVSVRSALAQSRNVTAIKAYYLAGEQENIVPFTEGLGVKFLDGETEHGSSLALGSAEVNLMSLVQGYMTLANYGIRKDPVMLLKIENNEGEILEELEVDESKSIEITFEDIEEDKGEEVENLDELTPAPAEEINATLTTKELGEMAVDPEAAYLITSILSDTEHRLGPNLTVPGWQNVAKTGTSNKREINDPEDEDDDKILPSNTLTLGYTTELVTGVWSGNSDGSVLRWNANGYDTAAPIWKSFMTRAHKHLTENDGVYPRNFRAPSGIKKIEVSKASGLLPNEETTPEDQITEEVFASYAIPTEVEDKFVTIEIDKKTKKLWVEGCPEINRLEKPLQIHETIFSDYTDWQEGIDTWAEEEDMLVPEDLCIEDYDREFDVDPTLLILAPFNHGEVPYKPFKVYTFADSPNGIANVEFYLGDQLQFQDKTSPYIGTIRPPVTARDGSKRTITVRAYDHYGFATEEKVQIRFDKRLKKIDKPDGFDQLYERTTNNNSINDDDDNIDSGNDSGNGNNSDSSDIPG